MPPGIKIASLSFTSEYDPKETETCGEQYHNPVILGSHLVITIQESVDSPRLGRDDATDSPIVCIHAKAF